MLGCFARSSGGSGAILLIFYPAFTLPNDLKRNNIFSLFFAQDMCHQSDAKCHEATLECDRLHILLADFKNRAETQTKTAQNTEKELREKIEVLRVDMQSMRVSAMEAAAATTEEVTRGHEVRQGLIDDLSTTHARISELESENRDLMEGTLQQDRLLNASVNESIDLGHRVMENDINLASINERQKNEINELNESMELREGNIRSSVEDIERQVTEKYINEMVDLQSQIQELENNNKVLQSEKLEFLDDMQSTYETVGKMESRLNSLVEENSALKLEIRKTHNDIDQNKVWFPNSSLKSITSLESKSPSDNERQVDILASPDKALIKIATQTRTRGNENPPVAGRLERLEMFIETLQARQEAPPTTADKQVVFNIEALLGCLNSIKQESEEMVVHTSTKATTSLLRQLRHRKSMSDKKSASVVTSPHHVVQMSETATSPQQRQTKSKRKEYPGNVILNTSCCSDDSDTDEDEFGDDFFDENFDTKRHLERQGSERSLGSKHRQSPAELFTQMDFSGDGFISLPEFIKAVRKYETVGKVVFTHNGLIARFLHSYFFV
jgi:regulator of replication initiation timing